MPTWETNSSSQPANLQDYLTLQEARFVGNKAVGMRDSLRSQPSSLTPPPPPPKDRSHSPGAAAAAQAASVRLGASIANQGSAYPTLPMQRKPVATANQPVAQQPQGAIKRKPVGARPTPITVPSTSSVQEQQQQRVLSPDGNIRTIFRDANGKIDPRTIQSVPVARWTPPPSPSAAPVHNRPSSRGSFRGFGKSNRADTNGSSTGRAAGSRRSSITEIFKSAGRRLSDVFKDTTIIVKMSEGEREDWIGSRAEEKKRASSQRSDERESYRRENPRARPGHQKDALVDKHKHIPELAHDHADTATNFDAMLAQSESHAAINRGHRKSHEAACLLAAEQGKPPPRSPADLPVADLTLSPKDRKFARQNTAPKHIDELATEGRESPPHFTTGEKVAIALSGLTDPLKPRGRSNTADSAMSFGMTDKAPPEMMHVCTRCNRPPEDFLHSSGLCNSCFIFQREQRARMAKEAKAGPSHTHNTNDSMQAQQIHDPVSPPYMKLAGKKKLRKVRQTIYEDPGNPFAEGDEDVEQEGEMSIFSMPSRPAPNNLLGSVHEGGSSVSPFDDMNSKAPSIQPTGKPKLLNGSPWDDAVESPSVPLASQPSLGLPSAIHAPTPQRHGTPTIIQKNRQSMSVAVIPESPLAGSAGEYVAPRTLWRRESLPRSIPPEENTNRNEGVRDTKFYGFYDEILDDYKTRESRL